MICAMAYLRSASPRIVSPAALACALGCNMPNPAFGGATDGGSAGATRGSGGGDGSAGSASASATSMGSASATGTSTSAGPGPSTTGQPTTGGQTSMSTTGGMGDTGMATVGNTGATGTTGGPLCQLPPPASEIVIKFKEGDAPATVVAGSSVSINGILTGYNQGVWTLERCNGNPNPCDGQCMPDVKNALVFKALPLPLGQWDPPAMNGQDACYQAVVFWNGDGSFQGGYILPMEEGGMVGAFPVWAARGRGPAPAAIDNWLPLQPALDHACACEMDGCCQVDPQPGEYVLKTDNVLDLGGTKQLKSGEVASGMWGTMPIDIINVESVMPPMCGAIEQFTWILKESG